MLAIEIDGSSHDSPAAQQRDLARQTRLESLGVKFLRFREAEVRHQTDAVVAAIADWVVQHRTCPSKEHSPTPCPSKEGILPEML